MTAKGATEDQDALAAFLGASGVLADGAPKIVETHGAFVFLTGDRAFKLKRDVQYDFMDFSSRERRNAAAAAELRLNRRTAPQLYLGLTPVFREAGGFRLGSLSASGAIDPNAEHLIVMRRFDEAAGLDRLAAAGTLGGMDIDRLVDSIVRFHVAEPAVDVAAMGEAASTRLARVSARTMSAFSTAPSTIGPDTAAPLVERMAAAVANAAPVVDARAAAGRIKRLHGDLHLANVAMIDGEPVIFDALEFDDDMATVDQLHDLAFLIMDLWARGVPTLAARAWSRYLAGVDDYSGLTLGPLFVAMRAAVRTKVAIHSAELARGAAKQTQVASACAYAEAALAALAPPQPRLIAIGGLSGTGKTTLARDLAAELAPATGATHLRSDVLRKRRAGVGFEQPAPARSYSQVESDAVYAGLLDRAETALTEGAPVILDAVFAKPEERRAAAALAARLNAPFTGIWLDLPLNVRQARIEARGHDASDATAAVAAKQAAYDLGEIDWARMDGDASAITRARRALGLQ